MSKEKEKKIKKLVAKFNDPLRMAKIMIERKERLQALVDKHGIESVVLAGGYAESTLKQYLRNRMPNIGLEGLDQAETILNEVDEG